jgi:ribosomal protein S27AE
MPTPERSEDGPELRDRRPPDRCPFCGSPDVLPTFGNPDQPWECGRCWVPFGGEVVVL